MKKKLKFKRQSSVEIIIIKYNAFWFERNTLRLVIRNTSEPYHMTVWQNHVKDENLSVIWNKMIERSTADYICLLNTDVEVPPNWLDNLLEVFKKEKNVGIVSCLTNNCGTLQQKQKPSKTYKVRDSKMLSGFCLVFPKKIWKEVGGFDEEYVLYGEDAQFCYDVNKLGYRLLIRKDVFIYHYKGQSSVRARAQGKDTLKIAAESAKMFHQKTKGEYVK